jgi:hypothetical protein
VSLHAEGVNEKRGADLIYGRFRFMKLLSWFGLLPVAAGVLAQGSRQQNDLIACLRQQTETR